MRIAYDIAVLGRGHIDFRSRTGIFRAIESLMNALQYQASIKVIPTVLSTSVNFWDDILSGQYFLNELKSKQLSFYSSYEKNFSFEGIYRIAYQVQQSLIKTSRKEKLDLYHLNKLVKYALLPLLGMDYKYSFEELNCSIYHSPFLKLPPASLTGRATRVITIYDMIPVIFPQYVTLRNRQKFHGILDSIDLHRDWVVCDSENTKEDFCSYMNMSKDRVCVAPLAASEIFRQIREPSSIRATLNKYEIPERPYLLSLCTLEPRKNLDFVVKSFYRLITEMPNFQFNLVLVGAVGWKIQPLLDLVSSLGNLKERVILTGYVSDEDLSALYSGAKAFVYPSLYEGFGLPPLEAMQCGVPVITSNNSSLPEVVGDAGLMINPTDTDEFCQTILNLTGDSVLQEGLSRRGIERAASFSWAKCAEQTADFYKIASA